MLHLPITDTRTGNSFVIYCVLPTAPIIFAPVGPLVPAALRMVLHSDLGREDLASIRAVTSGTAPLPVTFTTLVAQGDRSTYTVNFGDGTTSGPMTVGPSGISCKTTGPCYSGRASTSHTYTAGGTYSAGLGRTGTFSLTFPVLCMREFGASGNNPTVDKNVGMPVARKLGP